MHRQFTSLENQYSSTVLVRSGYSPINKVSSSSNYEIFKGNNSCLLEKKVIENSMETTLLKSVIQEGYSQNFFQRTVISKSAKSIPNNSIHSTLNQRSNIQEKTRAFQPLKRNNPTYATSKELFSGLQTQKTIKKIRNYQRQFDESKQPRTKTMKQQIINFIKEEPIEGKRQKRESIKRLQSKVNEYLSLLEDIKLKASSKSNKTDFKSNLVKNIKQLENNKHQSQRFTQPSTPQKQIKQLKDSSQKIIQKQFKISLDSFIVLKKKGFGRLGQVLLALHIETGFIYALKKIKKQFVKQNGLIDYVIQEIKIQHYIDNPNLVKIYGEFQDQDFIYLILEYIDDGSLDQKMEKRGYHTSNVNLLSEEEISSYLRDILNGINALHQKEIMHRDIKPANVVITNNVCKLCDFGWATLNPNKGRRTTYCGTFDYAPPQIFKGDTYDLQVDLWQFGVLAYELVAGKLPFYTASRQETLKRVINYSGNLNFPVTTSTVMRDFILNLLQQNPQDRLPALELLKHPLMKLCNIE